MPLCHFIILWRIIPFCPTPHLLTDDRTVKSGTKIFCVFTHDNLRYLYDKFNFLDKLSFFPSSRPPFIFHNP